MKPRIKRITFDKETLEKVNKILNSGFNDRCIHTRLRQIGIRSCLVCGSIADTQLIYEVGDKEQRAQHVESYCDKCLQKSNQKE